MKWSLCLIATAALAISVGPGVRTVEAQYVCKYCANNFPPGQRCRNHPSIGGDVCYEDSQGCHVVGTVSQPGTARRR